MTDILQSDVNDENRWRLDAPEVTGWQRDVRPGTRKYYIVSCDTHISPPPKLFIERIEPEYRDRLPRIETRDGKRYLVQEGLRPERIAEPTYTGDDLARVQAGAQAIHHVAQERTGLPRIADQDMDGVDAEVIFPNGGALLMWGSSDVEFVKAQCRVWNDWAWETCGPHKDRMAPTAALATADIEGAVKEVERVAKMGYKALILPNKPIWGPADVSHINYNLPIFDPLWAAIQEHDLAMTFHVSTGMDPRTARGNGGAVINYVIHAMAPTMEPIVNLCASGVFERFPKLRAATIEADAGWVPWMMAKMDESYIKHHFWARPRMENLPSDYYRSNCFASFGEDLPAVHLAEEFRLEKNFMWANDYPHHEGSWPRSAQAIKRTFANKVGEQTRANLLGLNAARCFGFEVPKHFLD